MNIRSQCVLKPIALIVLLACSLLPLTAQQQDGVARTAFVHLFEWKWNDIADECECELGPRGL